MIREHGMWDNWRMIEIESRLVKDKREAERIEQEYIDKLKTDMNTRKSFINEETLKEQMKQYRIENADKNREYRIKNADKIKEYRIKNADKLKEQKRQYYIKKKEKSEFNASSLKENYLCLL